ncbi:MAG: AAA family ATPase [Thermoplasmata archaeon]|nr:AAA family ATPase [Thermoplasmata archaeon]
MRITISGPPGSGKTTACSKLAEVLGLEAVVFGRIFRELAAEKHLTLAELGEIAEKDPSIDNMIDDRILQMARTHEDLILESRLSAYMLSRNGIDAFKIHMDASPEVRMQRVGLREGETLEQATAKTIERQKSEAKRYLQWYGIDIGDLSVYDLVLNTDDLDPDQVIETILEAINARDGS